MEHWYTPSSSVTSRRSAWPGRSRRLLSWQSTRRQRQETTQKLDAILSPELPRATCCGGGFRAGDRCGDGGTVGSPTPFLRMNTCEVHFSRE